MSEPPEGFGDDEISHALKQPVDYQQVIDQLTRERDELRGKVEVVQQERDNLIDERKQFADECDELRTKLEKFTSEDPVDIDLYDIYVNGLKTKLEQLTRSECATRRELVSHREKAHGNYWAWDDTDENDVKSLVCPVLIHAEALLEILNRAEQAEAKVCEMRTLLEDEYQLIVGDYAPLNHALSGDCGKGWISPAQHAKKVKVLRESLSSIMRLIEEGQLVRNIEHDELPNWALNQLPFLKALSSAKQALAATAEPGGAQ